MYISGPGTTPSLICLEKCVNLSIHVQEGQVNIWCNFWPCSRVIVGHELAA